MKSQYNFRGASEYYLLEEERRSVYEQRVIHDPLEELRIRFREEFLNELVFRLENSHSKIQLLVDVLDEHKNKKRKKLSAVTTLEEEICEDALENNLLEVVEIVKSFCEALITFVHASYGSLFEKINNEALKNLVQASEINEYYEARKFLLGGLKDKPITCKAFNILSQTMSGKIKIIKEFRDKIISHKYDPERFKIRLSFKSYLSAYQYIRRFFDSVSIVASLQANNWDLYRDTKPIKNWLSKGLNDSLKN